MQNWLVFETDDPLAKDWYLWYFLAQGANGGVAQYLVLHGINVRQRMGSIPDRVTGEVIEHKSLAGTTPRLRVTVQDVSEWPEVEKMIDEIFADNFSGCSRRPGYITTAFTPAA